MTVYDYIYNFLSVYIFNSNHLSNDLASWICNTTTIVIMVLFVIALINLVIWCFKLGRHLLHL